MALPNGSFPRPRQVVLEAVRRTGVAPAKHGTSLSIWQVTRAVLEAVGGPCQFWSQHLLSTRQVDPFYRCDPANAQGFMLISGRLDSDTKQGLPRVTIQVPESLLQCAREWEGLQVGKTHLSSGSHRS